MCMCVIIEEFGLVNGFIDHLHTWLGTTSNYSAASNLHNSQTTTAPAKPFPAFCVFTSPSLATASNSGDSSASRARVLSSQPPVKSYSVKVKVTLRLTVSQSVLVSSPIWGSLPDIYYCLTVTVLLLWGALSDERTGLFFVSKLTLNCVPCL
jgi:hypothetical protein